MLGAIVFKELRQEEAWDLIQGSELYGPTLLTYELISIARTKVVRNPERLEALTRALRIGLDMDIQLVDIDHVEVLRLAIETGLSTYDASYLHVARVRGVPLVTFDERLRAAY